MARPPGALSGSSTSRSLHFLIWGMGTGWATSEVCREDEMGTCVKWGTRDVLSPPRPGGANSTDVPAQHPAQAVGVAQDAQVPRGLREPEPARTPSSQRGARARQQYHQGTGARGVLAPLGRTGPRSFRSSRKAALPQARPNQQHLTGHLAQMRDGFQPRPACRVQTAFLWDRLGPWRAFAGR